MRDQWKLGRGTPEQVSFLRDVRRTTTVPEPARLFVGVGGAGPRHGGFRGLQFVGPHIRDGFMRRAHGLIAPQLGAVAAPDGARVGILRMRRSIAAPASPREGDCLPLAEIVPDTSGDA